MTSTTPTRRVARAAIITLVAVVLAGCLGVVVFGTADLVTQLLAGTTVVTLHARPEGWTFGFPGPGGAATEGRETEIVAAVSGLSGGATAIGATAIAVGLLAWVILGLAGLALLRGIRTGRPFGRPIVRQVTLAGVGLLVLGTASQLMRWWATNATLDEFGVENNEWVYLRDLRFDPLTVAIGLTLLLAALAFRAGERLQRDAEGLV
ncbi:MAG: hypothetical protein QM598_12275 [Protaetiibacter sp.]